VLLEMSGAEALINGGFSALRQGGRAALLGLPGDDYAFDWNQHVIFKGATVLGINGRRMFETWLQMDDFFEQAPRMLEPIVTHTVPLSDVERGMEMMGTGEAVKVVLEIE
jgi:threonine 3-dehydrogenase